MLVHESRHVRRFVIRLEPGEDVLASIQRLARSELHRAGWVRGRGLLEWAELSAWDATDRSFRPARRIEGPLSVTFEGALAMRLGEPTVEIDAVVSREQAGVPHALGGRLVQGAALSIECLLEVFEDVRLERQEDETLGLPVWRTGDRVPGVTARARTGGADAAPDRGRAAPAARPPIEAPEPKAPPTAAELLVASTGEISWATVAAVSERAPTTQDDDPGSREPKKGDYVEHRQFGLCRVEGEDPDGGTRVRLPSGARKTLRLDVMDVLPPRREADRTVYPVRPRTR